MHQGVFAKINAAAGIPECAVNMGLLNAITIQRH